MSFFTSLRRSSMDQRTLATVNGSTDALLSAQVPIPAGGGARDARCEGEASFSCRDVAVDFIAPDGGGRRVLEHVDFDIRTGEFVSLLGGSGVGKTTLLRVLGGLYPAAAESDVRYRGQPIVAPMDGVVMVFQDYASSLLPWRTVERNVALGIEASVPRKARRSSIDDAIDMVGLSSFGKHYPKQLSGGMQQRVQIARALVTNPSTLLMDEPFGSLDAMTKASLQDELLRIHSETGATIVFVTHDIEEAVYMSDRVLVLTGAPARVGCEIRVDLDRPRDQVTTKEQPRYLELRHRVYEAIGEFHASHS